jgi:hypothetical protein
MLAMPAINQARSYYINAVHMENLHISDRCRQDGDLEVGVVFLVG